MSKLLITGIGGNVGKSLAYMLGDQYDVVGIYRSQKPYGLDCELLQAELAEAVPFVKDVDAIVHAAGCVSGSAIQMVRDNVLAMKNLLTFAKQYHVRHFIYLSTVSVYGKVQGELTIDSSIVNPGIYGSTKYISEELLREADVPMRMTIALPRMLGPFVNMTNTTGSGFLTMAKKILHNEDITCFIPEVQYNNYMHVEDLARLIEKLLQEENMKVGYQKILLGAGDRMPMRKILEVMRESVHSTSNIIEKTAESASPMCALIEIKEAERMGYSPMPSGNALRRFMCEQVKNGNADRKD